MRINSQATAQDDIIQCQNHIAKLTEMLQLNRNAQAKLALISQTIAHRKRQLEDMGAIYIPYLGQVDQNQDRLSALEQVKKVPTILADQQLIKKNLVNGYDFRKNVTQSDQQRNKKSKPVIVQKIIYQHLPANASKINFIQLSKNQKQKSGLQLYKQWRLSKKKKQTYQKQQKSTININEQKLLEKRKIYGDNWEKIGYYFNGFTFQNLYYYYQKHLNKVETGKWSLRQNLILIALVQYYGSGKWAMISKKLKVKSQFQIRQRFCNVLDPNIKQNKWSQQEEQLLLRQAKVHDYKWSKILKAVKQFENKTDNALRRKFRNIMIKKDDQEIEKTIKNKKLLQSILNFKKEYYNRSKKNQKKDQKQQENRQMEMEEENN